MNLHLRYDIALLRLEREATLNSKVMLGSLPQSGQILPHNNLCYITGWGRVASELQRSVWSFIVQLKKTVFLISVLFF